MMRWLNSITNSTDEFEQTLRENRGQSKQPGMYAAVHGVAKSRAQLNN